MRFHRQLRDVIPEYTLQLAAPSLYGLLVTFTPLQGTIINAAAINYIDTISGHRNSFSEIIMSDHRDLSSGTPCDAKVIMCVTCHYSN